MLIFKHNFIILISEGWFPGRLVLHLVSAEHH